MNAISKISSANSGTVAEETKLPAEAVLASATDGRGVISYANIDFCTIAEYDLEELMGAPHRIVRHPDMPRGVFYLLWETLKAGQPICAYVKNRTKSGKFYWVLATVSANENGFVSARIHPESEVFDLVKPLYADMLQREKDGASPEESANWLLDQLKGLGFADIGAFSVHALNAEFKVRGIVREHYENSFELMDELLALITEMRDLADDIERGFKRVRGEPVNLRILAGRLEGAGAALGTISQNYDAMAKEMYDLLGRLQDPTEGALFNMFAAVNHGRAAQQLAQLLEEAADREEGEDGNAKAYAELREHQSRMEVLCKQRVRDITLIGKTIPDICRSLRRRINGLDVVKLLCKVESGRMREVDSGLDGIIARLQDFHDNTDRGLAELSSKAAQIQQRISTF